ncbi:hypothetical protein Tco_0123623 [Tanacetum coccineum]
MVVYLILCDAYYDVTPPDIFFVQAPFGGVTDWYSEPSIPVILVVPDEVPIVPADPLFAPEVGAVFVISPTGVLDLVDYSSSSDFDPSEDSLPLTPELPLVSDVSLLKGGFFSLRDWHGFGGDYN